jgi:hypothetical protein
MKVEDPLQEKSNTHRKGVPRVRRKCDWYPKTPANGSSLGLIHIFSNLSGIQDIAD